jgi:hypothetical protein
VREHRAWWSSDGQPATLAEGEALLLAERWRGFLRAVCLEPLAACAKATRQGPTVLALQLEGGETWRLHYDPERMLPVSLIGPTCEVAFLSFTTTGTTNMPRRVRSTELGEREVRFENVDMSFDDLVFQDFGTRVGALRKKAPDRVIGREAKPKKPTLQQVRSDLLLVVDDPGTWPERIKLVVKEMEGLRKLGQASAGLPLFFTEKGSARIGIPFLPDAESGSPPFADKGGQRVVRRTTHTVVALHLVGTSIEGAIADGARSSRPSLPSRASRPRPRCGRSRTCRCSREPRPRRPTSPRSRCASSCRSSERRMIPAMRPPGVL